MDTQLGLNCRIVVVPVGQGAAVHQHSPDTRRCNVVDPAVGEAGTEPSAQTSSSVRDIECQLHIFALQEGSNNST